MPVRHLKSAPGLPPASAQDTSDTVRLMLASIVTGGRAAVEGYAARLDHFDGDIVVPRAQIETAGARIPADLRDAIAYAHANIRAFAEAQRGSITEFQIELRPGLTCGQRLIPVNCAGAYVPGGRYAHIASALMTIATARAAGVGHVIACSPPRDGAIPPAILHAMHLAGADTVLALGGVQAVAALAHGHYGPAADILVGPGNAYVAEAKRQLFGPTGIDMFAGPTDSMILADDTADARTVALDLVGQAEHGANSPVWLVTDSARLAAEVARRMPATLALLPPPNRDAATQAWDALGEIILCDSAEEMAETADRIGPEHLHVQAANLEGWLARLTSYGSLFLGAETTVAFGDKAAGPNHVLPTSGAARYTGGLSVHKFLKTVTWQRVTDQALPELARATAVISRAEGMEGHALTADARLSQARQPVPQLRAASDAD